ncbi:hypothetical protein DMENIID0001_060510 [Sergentomyia squamirostris]
MNDDLFELFKDRKQVIEGTSDASTFSVVKWSASNSPCSNAATFAANFPRVQQQRVHPTTVSQLKRIYAAEFTKFWKKRIVENAGRNGPRGGPFDKKTDSANSRRRQARRRWKKGAEGAETLEQIVSSTSGTAGADQSRPIVSTLHPSSTVARPRNPPPQDTAAPIVDDVLDVIVDDHVEGSEPPGATPIGYTVTFIF